MIETTAEVMPKLGMCEICLVRRAGAIEHTKDARPIHIQEICTHCYTIVYGIKDHAMLERLVKYLSSKFEVKK